MVDHYIYMAYIYLLRRETQEEKLVGKSAFELQVKKIWSSYQEVSCIKWKIP